jgi:hypothetical protein
MNIGGAIWRSTFALSVGPPAFASARRSERGARRAPTKSYPGYSGIVFRRGARLRGEAQPTSSEPSA